MTETEYRENKFVYVRWVIRFRDRTGRHILRNRFGRNFKYFLAEINIVLFSEISTKNSEKRDCTENKLLLLQTFT
jgi:hypothetical protein